MTATRLRSLVFVPASAVVAAWALGACATTIDDPASDAGGTTTADVTEDVPAGAEPALDSGEPIDGGTISDPDAPASTTAMTGSAIDLLPEMAIEMSRLGSLIADGGDDEASLARIEQIWERIRPEIDADRPDLVNGIQTTVDMARIAVERTRPADADKAFSLLTDLVDAFTGDG